jgi:hypothetical protein
MIWAGAEVYARALRVSQNRKEDSVYEQEAQHFHPL